MTKRESLKLRMMCIILTLALTALWGSACDGGGGNGGDTDNEGADNQTADRVVINEVMSVDPAGVDWIELHNPTGAQIDIGYHALRDNKDRDTYIVPAGTMIPAGGFWVVEQDDSGTNGFTFGLGSADAVRLYDSVNELTGSTNWIESDVSPGKSWGRSPDGIGGFKTLITPTRGAANLDLCGNGQIDAGEVCDGTNLADQSCQSQGLASGDLACDDQCRFDFSRCNSGTTQVAINEVVAKWTDVNDVVQPDWIELFNPGAEADLSGWSIRDSADDHIYYLPAGTNLSEGGYLVVSQDDTGAGGFEFGLGKADSVRLYDKTGELVDETSWTDGQAPLNESWGRIPDGTGAFQTLLRPTKGAANTANSDR